VRGVRQIRRPAAAAPQVLGTPPSGESRPDPLQSHTCAIASTHHVTADAYNQIRNGSLIAIKNGTANQCWSTRQKAAKLSDHTPHMQYQLCGVYPPHLQHAPPPPATPPCPLRRGTCSTSSAGHGPGGAAAPRPPRGPAAPLRSRCRQTAKCEPCVFLRK